MKMIKIAVLITSFTLFSCQPQEDDISKDPVSALNALVSPYGFIGFQNAMEKGEGGTHTGILVGGRPTGLVYVSNAETCFPQNDFLPRYEDKANVNKTFSYSFQGNLGFLTLGIPIVSAGLGIQKSMTIDVEIDGLVIEYLDSIDVTDWYRDGIRDTCREYLQEVGFMIQTIHTSSMKLSIKRLGGTNIGLNAENVSNFFQFEAGVNWEIINNETIEITSPHTLGYQIALMKPEDMGQVLYRATRVQDDSFVFERIGFSDFFNNEVTKKSNLPKIKYSENVFLDQ